MKMPTNAESMAVTTRPQLKAYDTPRSMTNTEMSDYGLRRAARRQDRVKRRRKRSACGCGLEIAAHAVALTIGIHTSAHTTCLLLFWHLICTAAQHSARNLGNLSRTQPQSSVSPSSKSRTPTVLQEQ